MYKRLLAALISMVILFGTSTVSFAAIAPQNNIEQSKVKLQQLNGRLKDTNSKISDLNVQIDKLNATIKNNKKDIDESAKQIKAAETKRNELSAEVDKNQHFADKRIRAMYMISYNNDYLSMILSSKGLSDFISKIQAIYKITSLDKRVLKDFEAKREELNKIVDELNLKKQQLQELKSSNEGNLKLLNNKKTELNSLASQLAAEMKSATLVIQQNEEKLVAHSISVINSQNPTYDELRLAITTLKSLLSQLNSASVKKKVADCIEIGNKKLAVMKADGSKSNTTYDRGNVSVKATYSMVATAYAIQGLTASGLKTVRDPEGLSTIAVDPSVIPLGTKVYIPGYGYAIAADTGGAIKGNKIDLFLESEYECFQWGVRNITLDIIAYPGEW